MKLARLTLPAQLALILALALAPAAASADQVWDRPVGPGLAFRMERREDPPLNIYGIRIDPERIQMEPALAGNTVYDAGRLNGRATLTDIVEENGAIGGVNGDFFQFGADPGGDPTNLMVRGGELLSHPVSSGRNSAAAWGRGLPLRLGAASWNASFAANGGPRQPIQSLNSRVDSCELSLHTESAGIAYSTVPAVVARVAAGAYRLGPQGRLTGEVVEVKPLIGRLRTPPGEFLIAGGGEKAAAVGALKPGDKIEVRVSTSGFDWPGAAHAVGGGPILLRGGQIVVQTGPDSFRDTRHPRTALGRTGDGALWLVAVDGRQSMSNGATIAEMAEIMRRWGCIEAINLDGGGSTTMNLFGLTLNRPSSGEERPIANAVVLFGATPPLPVETISVAVPAAPVEAGSPVSVEVSRGGELVPPEQVLYTAQGAGWIDQEGVLHPVKPGVIEVAVLVHGAVARTRVTVAGRTCGEVGEPPPPPGAAAATP